jgi:hypothetical protein
MTLPMLKRLGSKEDVMTLPRCVMCTYVPLPHHGLPGLAMHFPLAHDFPALIMNFTPFFCQSEYLNCYTVIIEVIEKGYTITKG